MIKINDKTLFCSFFIIFSTIGLNLSGDEKQTNSSAKNFSFMNNIQKSMILMAQKEINKSRVLAGLCCLGSLAELRCHCL